MSEALETLRRGIVDGLEGDPWHGPSLRSILSDLTPEEAAAHPIPGGHSIVEIVAHIWSWLEEVSSRLRGNAPAQPAAGDWPAVAGDARAAWEEGLARLAAARTGCEEAVAAFPGARLGDVVGTARDAPLGTGVTFEVMLAGLAQHDAYHSGQIAILKRAARASSVRDADAAARIRAAFVDAATRAYEDAGMKGLCAEGRWEAAVSALRSVEPVPGARS